jgi:hypothetical protein
VSQGHDRLSQVLLWCWFYVRSSRPTSRPMRERCFSFLELVPYVWPRHDRCHHKFRLLNHIRSVEPTWRVLG